MRGRRQNDLQPLPVTPDIKQAVDQALKTASQQMKPADKCDCQPGQCTKGAQYCKDWEKRGRK